MNLSDTERAYLLSAAAASIDWGFGENQPLLPDLSTVPDALLVPAATFVTLEIANDLRGCIGTLEARLPLIHDVAENAFRAAFRDPRFLPLAFEERSGLEIKISVLSPPEPMTVATEKDLLVLLRPGMDGLILEDLGRRGTFLPAVWEDLPDPQDFLRQLKRKAGLSDHHWSETLRVSRYTVVSIP